MPKKLTTPVSQEDNSAQRDDLTMPLPHTEPDGAGIHDHESGIRDANPEHTPLSHTEPELDENSTGLQEFQAPNISDSHTDLETDRNSGNNSLYGSGAVNSTPFLHTDPKQDENELDFQALTSLQPGNAPDSHTELESGDYQTVSSENPPDEADKTANSHTDSEEGKKAAGNAPPAVKSPRRRASQSRYGGGLEPDGTDPEPDSNPAPTRRRRARVETVLAIDDERRVETQAEKIKNDLLDLVESQKGRKILSGTIQGVERSAENPNISFAVIYHGAFKVIIPAEETVQPPEDFRDRSPADVMHYLVTKRLGAEIDYIVKGVDSNSGLAAASRLEAMALKRRQYYFGTDRNGINLIYEGLSAEARVVSVIRAGIFVDLFGLETYISLRELSYQRWIDAASHFQPGQRVLVKILTLDRSSRDNIRVSASVKQAGENPYEQALKRYTPGSRYVGTVSLADTNGVFVSLDGGIDCLCSYPKRGRPPRGARVTVRVIGINHESNRIWGAITHMTTAR